MRTFKSLQEIDFPAQIRTNYFPSPRTWEHQVLYFLLLDRFSDGNEIRFTDIQGNIVKTGTTPAFTFSDAGNAILTEPDAAHWRKAGQKFVGGRLAINTDYQNTTIAYVTIDNDLHAIDSKLKCLYASGNSPQELTVEVRNGKAIRLTIAPAGFVIYG